ncbi:hypothetical protein LBSP_20970 [Lentilactobacillus buchneri subsp. silagei]|uniref:hypothetical protein n=1 Tax=Lentilactobacillus buchneri TaxID=1581 RepID=UPI0012E6C320|nr:hypothetical protein [Lentilactobacillus buchneri]GED95537.1 hypothetical protein LBSP_20970 [Lentilactobacillus buchneri subsp. silagei]
MLNKNYSTATILFAANVIDGGKKLDDVPALFKGDVSELVKTLAGDTPTTKTTTQADSSGNQANVTEATDPTKQTVVINPDDTKKEG